MPRPPQRKQQPEATFIGHYAGFVTRFVAFLIDILIVSLGVSLMWGAVALIFRFFSLDLKAVLTLIAGTNSFLRAIIVFITGFGFTFVLTTVYNVFFWMLAGKTLGKAVMGLRVIGPRGGRVTFARALRRSVGYWASALPLFLGFLWVLFTDERVGWHDIFAGTRVIYDYEAKYSEAFLGRLGRLAPRLEKKLSRLPQENQEQLPNNE